MSTLNESLARLFRELVDGAPKDGAFMLNGGDPGLLRSLESLDAAAASAPSPSGGASIAAHVDHLRYGISLMNRWSDGDPDPWAGADWTESWKRTAVTEAEWAALRNQLLTEVRRWQEALTSPRSLETIELDGVIGSVAHLAYHLGAIRQIDRSLRGPAA
ncbi:MAG: DinB family protein [Acidobacteriota bacterium]|nr:DinB family protein [Acidobacteriota bacterium]